MSANAPIVSWARRKTSIDSPLASPLTRSLQSNNHHHYTLSYYQQNYWYYRYREWAKKIIQEWIYPILTTLTMFFFIIHFLVDFAALTRRLTRILFPVAAVVNIHFWHVILNRRAVNLSHLHSLICGNVFGEILGYFLPCDDLFLSKTFLHSLSVTTSGILTGLTVGQSIRSSAMFVGTRFMLSACLPSLEGQSRAAVCYVAGVAGVALAKHVEAAFTKTMTASESRLNRRRRTSNCCGCSLYCICKTRRTSLPTLGGSHRGSHHPPGNHQGSSSGVDVALLAEAHGLVTDMLADPQLPPHVVGGLRSLAALLAPPNHVTVNHRLRPGGASVSLADFNSGSDTEEMIPYTGEKPSTLSKRFRRNLPPSLLRRMSTSTWTTTTSATGLPTLEPEPSRKRSTSFRHQGDTSQGGSSPSGAASPRDGTTSPQGMSPSRSSSTKGRSYSTTSIPTTASLCRRNSRDRKTVCSLHPLTACDIDALQEAHSAAAAAAAAAAHAEQRVAPDADESVTTEEDDEGGQKADEQPLPPLPCFRRVNITSDYESSNESPGSSDNNDVVLSGSMDDGLRSRMPKSLPVQTCLESELSRCSLCGSRTKHGQSVDDMRSPVSATFGQDFDDLTPTAQDEQELDSIPEGPGILVDGHRYDLDSLTCDPLLNRINEWDYPVFELQERSKDLILSQMCFRVFQEVGLFEAFKIPFREFLNYFHALEMGYRDKPYHNRMHAADVLQGVYHLTSQPIPGFTQISSDATNSPLHKSMEGTASEHGRLVHRPSFAAEVTYGVMGANYPALELMALYAAAAMHDYDHPGRTNAFLVSTYAPQAVLYNDRSVLENHHAASAWNLFLSKPEFNWLCHLDKAEFKRFRFLVIECILATDLKRHFEILAEFNAKANDDDAPGLDWMSETDRLLAMEMCIKLADINGPCKRHDIHVQWTYRIAEEFYEQGDEEAELGLQVSPFMDRNNPQLAKLQESFINHLVAPLCNAYGEAALLPGVWVESSESDDEDGPLDLDHCDSSDSKETEDEIGDSDSSMRSALRRRGSQPIRRRKVSCLQAQHLQENYEFWVNILKKEQLEEQVQLQIQREAEQDQEDYDSKNNFELPESDAKPHHQEDMETIEEENGQPGKLSKDAC